MDNYTLEELFDCKNFSKGFLKKTEECIEVNKNMKILFCDIDGIPNRNNRLTTKSQDEPNNANACS